METTTSASTRQPQIIDGLGDTGSAKTAKALDVLNLDKRTYDRALDCVHCGLCLPACPTYTENGLEADSPRGRIMLMKGMADGQIEPTDQVLKHLDLCLDCRACETACPSGVVYHELIEETRERLSAKREKEKTFVDKLVEWMFFKIFPYPSRLKAAMLGPRILQRLQLWRPLTGAQFIRKRLPDKLDKMQQLLPEGGPLIESDLATHYPADPRGMIDGKPKAVVGMFAGCVGSVIFQDVNRHTIALLQLAGCEVLVPRSQMCCGAIHHHGGHWDEARRFAKANINAFLPTDGRQVDFIVNNAAGCGAMLRDYHHLMRDDAEYAGRASEFEKRTRDISELLIELGLPKPKHAINDTVTYHDACHLAHAQRIISEPRDLLSTITGLHVIRLPESDMCCGAAGTYNLSQPQMARQLAERKLSHVEHTGAKTCVTGNVGCAMQIESEARRVGMTLSVKHPVTLLYEAHFGRS